ncbi:pectinesterase family protein [Luteolibacter soli]|uniref:Pectinesterase family protein n=1 Tax=Luteolibacter soli TaxID=3135280 RepID=A0ABU9AQH3_9BACT
MKPFLPAWLLVFSCAIVPCFADPLAVPALSALPLPADIDAVISTGKDSKFKTLQEAVDAAPDHATKPYVILLKPGRYRWQQTLIPKSKRFIHLVGENPVTTTVSFHLNVYETLKERRLENLEGITLIAQGDDFRATNLTIENTSGDHGQALALRLDGDRCAVRNCRLLGWQDTLMANNGRHYFKDCYIEGRVDFIYGSGTAFFEGCELRSKNGGYVTAASTPEENPFGYVFSHCKLTADPTPWDAEASNKKPPLAFLGRPWRPNASVIFLRCEMGSHIHPDGWNNWDKAENEKTARYGEYQSTGPGARVNSRVKWSRQLTDEQAKAINVEKVFGGSDGWNPAKP